MVVESKREKAAFLALPAGDKAFEMQETLDQIEQYAERMLTNAKGDQILNELKEIHKTLHSIDLGLNVVAQVITDRFPVATEAPVQPDKPMVVNQFIPGEVTVRPLIKCLVCGRDLPEYEYAQSHVRLYRIGERTALTCKKCYNAGAKQRRIEFYWPLVLAHMSKHLTIRGTPEELISLDQRFTPESFYGVFDGLHGTKKLKFGTILRFLTELSSEGIIASIKGQGGHYYVLYDDVDVQPIIDGWRQR